jgi:hypothetical protein
MAEVDTYGFDLKEVAAALVKKQGIHEGLWMLAFEFNLGAGVFGANKEDVRPAAFVQINKISLVRAHEISNAPNLIVNAAEINLAQNKTAKDAVQEAVVLKNKPLHKDRKPKPATVGRRRPTPAP